MANFRSIYKVQIFLTILVHLALALYEDQVGKFDWKRSFVGKVKFVSIEAKRIIVATEENVIASLNIKTGDIQWRQILEDPSDYQIQFLKVNRDILTVSGSKTSWLVRNWDINSGTLLSEWSITADKTGSHGSVFTLFDEKLYHILVIPNSHLDVTIYPLSEINTSNFKKIQREASAPWIGDISECITSGPYLACIALGKLYYINLSGKSFKFNSQGNMHENTFIVHYSQDEPSALLISNNIGKLAVFHGEDVHIRPYEVMPNAIGFKKNGEQMICQLEANDNKEKPIRVKIKSQEAGTDIYFTDLYYPVGLGSPIILSVTETYLVLTTTDHALLLVQLSEGKILWTREEALSSIVATEFFELPVSDLDASIEHEFDSNGSVFNMFMHRIFTQSQQLYNLLFGMQLLEKTGLVRDEFGLHKIIVVATRAGKLFALDTLSGLVVWSYRLPNIQPFIGINGEETMILLAQRTAQYSSLPSLCTLLAQDAITGNGIMFQFDPITGHSIKGIQRLSYKILQATVLPHHDQNYIKPILVLSELNEPYLYPRESFGLLEKYFSTTFLYTVQPETSTLMGYNLKYSNEKALKLLPTWKMHLQPSTIVGISTKPLSERVHSQGKVLFDRSVYYKYINPNLLAVATISHDSIHHNVVSIYLVDGVTGLVLYSTSHKRAKGPVYLVHSENWLVYTYFNERFRRVEVAAIELYEGHLQSNSTVFSSFAVGQLPDIQTQSYILSATPRKMAVTLTERGITNKFLLIALSNGAVIDIPWMLLQPRFAGMPCGPEESCIPYMPEIPLHSEAIINYNQTLNRIKGIVAVPARLESTSHVLVHGLDIFYTRIAPSKTFDVLKEDFDHRLIVLVLSGLIIASFVTKHLAAQKTLKQAWK